VAVACEVADLPTIIAREIGGRSLLWWPCLCFLQRWGRSTVELLLLVLWAIAPILLLRSTQLS
jgi:hypothetical protein